MNLRWTAEALADRAGIFDYIEPDNPAAALALDELFSEKAIRLADHPMLGRRGRVDGTRELVVIENYVLAYEVTKDAICILRLLHASMKWPSMKVK